MANEPSTLEVRIPDIGDFDDVEVVELLVSPGDRVSSEDSLVTLESDKATMEIPSPAAGTVLEIKLEVGDRVSEGSLVLVLSTDAPQELQQPADPSPVGTAPSAWTVIVCRVSSSRIRCDSWYAIRPNR